MNNNQLKVGRDKKVHAIKVSNATLVYQALRENDLETALAYSDRKGSKRAVKRIVA